MILINFLFCLSPLKTNRLSDKDNLFVPSAIHVELVYLRPSQPTVVPCRVTDARARVSLHREVPPEEITANNATLVTYDPTKGFVLQKPTEDYQGVFYCKAVTSGTPQISTKFQLLFVDGRDTSTATNTATWWFLVTFNMKYSAICKNHFTKISTPVLHVTIDQCL